MSIAPIGLPTGPIAPVVPGLGGVGGVGAAGAAGSAADAAAAAAGTSGADFGTALAGGLENLQRLQATSNDLAVRAVTGDLRDVHDYTIAASRAAVATELTVAVRNKAVEAFTEIMRMPL